MIELQFETEIHLENENDAVTKKSYLNRLTAVGTKNQKNPERIETLNIVPLQHPANRKYEPAWELEGRSDNEDYDKPSSGNANEEREDSNKHDGRKSTETQCDRRIGTRTYHFHNQYDKPSSGSANEEREDSNKLQGRKEVDWNAVWSTDWHSAHITFIINVVTQKSGTP